ncbi:immunoglobulin-like domain-containing protein [Jeotgalibacillus proteolyticus]|uniref:Bacterial Ig-like domain-containing protein n=1 Tax=Jeotgalibacillus proteolyticus TaxID=2082395 RepID=A0A2S5GCL8_9BACL|nr:immunoglobulin-like domain-containing protein [Jeotgalibacillus proteolyticus]PPA70746.1 hypothetical protein C4B60_08105 [Jeotgalibacillus proteolyticus]
MKKFLGLCIAALLTLLSACGIFSDDDAAGENEREPSPYETVNNFDGVTMNVKEGTVSSTGLTIVFENSSDKQGTYGEHFSLEETIEGSWYKVPDIVDGDYAFTDIGFGFGPSAKSEWTVEWEWLYGGLEAGEYRIVKDVLDFREAGDYDTYYLAAEFIIK